VHWPDASRGLQIPLCPHREESEESSRRLSTPGLTFAVPPNPLFELPLPSGHRYFRCKAIILVAMPPRNDPNLPGALVRVVEEPPFSACICGAEGKMQRGS